LLALADEVKLKEAIDAYYSGKTINQTEGRAVGKTKNRSIH